MFVQKFPSGITVVQAKKDAKILASSENIELSKAQDKIAFLHGRSSWAVLMQQITRQSDLKFRFGKKSQVAWPANKSLTMLTGQAGSGKSILLAEIATQLLIGGHKLVLLTHGNLNSPTFGLADHAFRQLKMRYASSFTVLANDYRKDLSELEINGAVLLIDDFEFINEKYGKSALQALIRCTKHVFIACQYTDECFSIDVHAGVQAIFLQNFRFIDLNPSDFQGVLEFALAPGLFDAIKNIRAGRDFREFIYLNDSGFELVHYEFGSGSIMSVLADVLNAEGEM